MALSNAEKQRRWRARHLGIGGTRELIESAISIPAKRNLERLACHYNCTMTKLLEMLINKHTLELLSKLNEEEKNKFYAQLGTCQSVQRSAEATWDIRCFYSQLKLIRSDKTLNDTEDIDQ